MSKKYPFKYRFIFDKLSSANVLFVVVLNLLIPLVTHFSLQIVLNFQLEKRMLDELSLTYIHQIRLFSILLNVLILGILDYQFLVKPIVSLENTVKGYLKSLQIKYTDACNHSFTESSLEKMFYDIVYQQKTELDRQQQAELDRQETEIFALQSQMDPHFLYNTLDSIRGLALLHDEEAIADMVEALSKLFKITVANKGQLVTLKEELGNVDNYVRIQQFRFQNRFTYRCNIDEELQGRYMISTLTIQPLVENAIVHGLESRIGGGKILVGGYCTKKRLIITVYDNGIGIEDNKLQELNQHFSEANGHPYPFVHSEEYSGIALANINRRLKLIFGDAYGVYIYSTQQAGTTVELTLPLIEMDVEEYDGNLFE